MRFEVNKVNYASLVLLPQFFFVQPIFFWQKERNWKVKNTPDRLRNIIIQKIVAAKIVKHNLVVKKYKNLWGMLTWPNEDDRMSLTEICEHDRILDND